MSGCKRHALPHVAARQSTCTKGVFRFALLIVVLHCHNVFAASYPLASTHKSVSTLRRWGLISYSLQRSVEIRGGSSSLPDDDVTDEDDEEFADAGDYDDDDDDKDYEGVTDVEPEADDYSHQANEDSAPKSTEAAPEEFKPSMAAADHRYDASEVEQGVTKEASSVSETITAITPSFPSEETHNTVDNDDSSAFVDRMELADAYDEGDSTSFEHEGNAEPAVNVGTEVEPINAAKETTTEADSTKAPQPDPGSVDAIIESSTPEVVPAIITDEMKKALFSLGYRRSDIPLIKPSVAAVVIEKQLQRPVEGMPENWYLPGKNGKPGKLSFFITRVLLPILAGAIALKGGMELDLYSFISSSPTSSSYRTPSSSIASSTTYRSMTEADVAYYSSIIAEVTGKTKAGKQK